MFVSRKHQLVLPRDHLKVRDKRDMSRSLTSVKSDSAMLCLFLSRIINIISRYIPFNPFDETYTVTTISDTSLFFDSELCQHFYPTAKTTLLSISELS